MKISRAATRLTFIAALVAASTTLAPAAYSATTLQASMAALDRSAAIPGTSWGVDTAAHQVVVTADSTVTGAKLDQLKAAMAKLGSTARLERTAGTMTPFIAGGDAITGGGFRCSLGFNVTRGGQAHLLTAGHCGNVTTTWSAGG
ncbi:MAG TPA: alpha-lytic protease prodomain-containing protein, partial [Amycolatopsis sp.]|nr:alpha-lytic protease prodomain-containing protein [Amycolatopsis sp.]